MSSVFTKIINGDLPGRFVYRDDLVVAFLSIEPIRYGHVLVVPVEETDRWTDLDPEIWAHANDVAQQVGRAIIEVFGSKRAGYLIAGFEVPHTHIHLFPADNMAGYDLSAIIPADQTDPEQMDAAAANLRAALDVDEDGRAH